jgi:hypothetical protein
MLRQRPLWTLVGVGIFLGIAQIFSGTSATGGGEEVRQGEAPNELIVTFSSKASLSDIREINGKLGVEVASQAFGGRVILVRLPKGKSLAEMKAAYEALSSVESVEPNLRVQIPENN